MKFAKEVVVLVFFCVGLIVSYALHSGAVQIQALFFAGLLSMCVSLMGEVQSLKIRIQELEK